MRIIPAIDIIDGKCVRLSTGDFNQKTEYQNSPLEMAKQFESNGIKHLHLVDLDGAKSGQIVNWKVLEQIANQTNLIIDFGGGVQSNSDIALAFNAGATQITAGSLVLKNEDLFHEWLSKYGGDKIILGADCLNGKIATNGWQNISELTVIDFINTHQKFGVKHVVSTDIAKDGMLQGPSIDLYKEILSECSVDLIASGGVTTLDDLIQLKQIGCDGAIIGKAIYEGTIKLKELSMLC